MTREHSWNTPPKPGNFTEMKTNQERLALLFQELLQHLPG